MLGNDEDGEPVTSAVVDAADLSKPARKPSSGKNKVAMQALYDALRDHGVAKAGSMYPANRKLVPVDKWREACGLRGHTKGNSESAARAAFKRAKDKLMDMDEVRECGSYSWKVHEDD
ncbi:MAG: hypothetical protein QNJ09_16985 [Paracoccaceae bacterium]|nr:hypothetical protein [Paracoccaceae bacterium]